MGHGDLMVRHDGYDEVRGMYTVDYYVDAHGEFGQGRRRMTVPFAARMDEYLNASRTIRLGHTYPT